jgi:hypothetical protein
MRNRIIAIVFILLFIAIPVQAEWLSTGNYINTGTWVNGSSWSTFSHYSDIYHYKAMAGTGTKIITDYQPITSLTEGKYYRFENDLKFGGSGGNGNVYYVLADNGGNTIRVLNNDVFEATASDANATRLYQRGMCYYASFTGSAGSPLYYHIVYTMAQLYEVEYVGGEAGDPMKMEDFWKIGSIFVGLLTGIAFITGAKLI